MLAFRDREIDICFNPLQVSYKPHQGNEEENEQGSFNPLQVSYKPAIALDLFGRSGKFQSLIGQLQTQSVNIHRTKQNICFNPLQVSYKQLEVLMQHFYAISFQSLIGQLQTIFSTGLIQLATMFQSLIGQLQTIYLFLSHSYHLVVSIPYRLATNHPDHSASLVLQDSFNPLQVSYKLNSTIIQILISVRFNPLQVSYKLSQHCVLSLHYPLFQSLIGQLQTPHDVFNHRVRAARFQSLIGQLQTYIWSAIREYKRGVSIPYRLATNGLVVNFDAFKKASFNPLQVSYKRNIRFSG